MICQWLSDTKEGSSTVVTPNSANSGLFKQPLFFHFSQMSTLKTGQMEGIVVSGILSGVLLTQCYLYFSKDLWGKPARIWIFIQFCLVAIRGLTVLMINAFPWINCGFVATFGLAVFQLWIVALQVVLYYRAWAFAVTKLSRRILTIICGTLWAAILGFRFYQVGTLQVTSKEGEFCKTIQTGINLSLVNFTLLMVTYIILLLPFIHRAMHSYFESVGDPEEGRKWLRLSLINILCVLFILFLEFFARFISPIIPNFQNYNGIMFSVINFLEANTVLFMMEDLKRQLLSGSRSQTYTQDKYSGSRSYS